MKELYAQNKLQTGADYCHAAMILQHGDVAEDYLLAHELCVVAISKGDTRAKWLAAASEAATYPGILVVQHNRGREITEYIINVTQGAKLSTAMSSHSQALWMRSC